MHTVGEIQNRPALLGEVEVVEARSAAVEAQLHQAIEAIARLEQRIAEIERRLD